MKLDRLSLGVRSLDSLLEGGVERGSLTQFYGEGGTGKTNICLQLTCLVAKKGEWVTYLDTEGLSMDRLSQTAEGQGTDLSNVLSHLLLATPRTLEEQEIAVERAASLMMKKEDKIGLVVLDSPTMLYRLSLGQDEEEAARQSLSTQMATLLHAALESVVPVVFTNQVWKDVSTGTFEPIGGSFLNHVSKSIIRLERLKNGWRRAVLVKHRSLPEDQRADFQLTGRGIESA